MRWGEEGRSLFQTAGFAALYTKELGLVVADPVERRKVVKRILPTVSPGRRGQLLSQPSSPFIDSYPIGGMLCTNARYLQYSLVAILYW